MKDTVLAEVGWFLLITGLGLAALYFGLWEGEYARGAFYFTAALFADRAVG